MKLKIQRVIWIGIWILPIMLMLLIPVLRDKTSMEYQKAAWHVSSGAARLSRYEALIKQGWLVREVFHLEHQVITTNSVKQSSKWLDSSSLREPSFLTVSFDYREPTVLTVTAYRDDMPKMREIIAQFDSSGGK
jgi:hypothetical protein